MQPGLSARKSPRSTEAKLVDSRAYRWSRRCNWGWTGRVGGEQCKRGDHERPDGKAGEEWEGRKEGNRMCRLSKVEEDEEVESVCSKER